MKTKVNIKRAVEKHRAIRKALKEEVKKLKEERQKAKTEES